jgi:hypothetical protein
LSQEIDREFSSIFVFKVKNRSVDTTAVVSPPPDLDQLSNSLMNKAFKFEPDNYQSGFAKPIASDWDKILLLPYYVHL